MRPTSPALFVARESKALSCVAIAFRRVGSTLYCWPAYWKQWSKRSELIADEASKNEITETVSLSI